MKVYTRALIIDDDLDLCTLLKAILQNYISEVLFAHSLVDSVKLLREMKPDVVFLDNNLPDGKGLELIKEFKLLLPGARIIAISAMPGLKKLALENGADIFIEKPLTETNVKRALEIGEQC
jgi:DNA-binding response OmpR family regulator